MATPKRVRRLEGRPVELTPDGNWQLCSCRVLDVHSQGRSETEARRNLAEAVALFLDSCDDLGTRGEVLANAGFRAVTSPAVPPPRCRSQCCPCHPVGGSLMPRLTPTRWQDLVRTFEVAGFELSRMRGDHMALTKPGVRRPVIIPRHHEIGVGLIEASLRTAGISRDEYFRLAQA